MDGKATKHFAKLCSMDLAGSPMLIRVLIINCLSLGNRFLQMFLVCPFITGGASVVVNCAEFHLDCIDQWLTTRRAFCPVCKRDAQSKTCEPIPIETTPLLAAVGRALGGPIHVGTSIASTQTSSSFNPPAFPSPIHSPDVYTVVIHTCPEQRGAYLC
jgi:E3 ubiquitin-protein ligase RNF13